MQSDYGKFVLTPIESGDDFWCLIKALQDDNSSFMNNISTIVERYKEGKLFGLRVSETDSMYKRGARTDDAFCRDLHGELSWYLLPCFCIVIGQTAEICWVHSKLRRMGLGKALVSLLKVEKAFHPLEESMPFWDACQVKQVTSL
jgi:hypothetical protein